MSLQLGERVRSRCSHSEGDELSRTELQGFLTPEESEHDVRLGAHHHERHLPLEPASKAAPAPVIDHETNFLGIPLLNKSVF